MGGTVEADGWPEESAYSLSKVADTLLARAIQEEFNETPERDIVVNAVSQIIPDFFDYKLLSFYSKKFFHLYVY